MLYEEVVAGGDALGRQRHQKIKQYFRLTAESHPMPKRVEPFGQQRVSLVRAADNLAIFAGLRDGRAEHVLKEIFRGGGCRFHRFESIALYLLLRLPRPKLCAAAPFFHGLFRIFCLEQKNVKSNPPLTLGLPATLEGEALEILARYEKQFAYRLPETELRSRCLQKLNRATVTSPAHLGALLNTIVHQALIDYGKEQSRHYERFVYDYAFDWPLEESGLPPQVQERLDELLDVDSPLDAEEKNLLRLMLEDPVNFMHSDGRPEQSALARHLSVAHTTIGRRWTQIVEKVAAWQADPPPLSI